MQLEVAQVGEPGLRSQVRPLTREDVASDEFPGLIRNMREANICGLVSLVGTTTLARVP